MVTNLLSLDRADLLQPQLLSLSLHRLTLHLHKLALLDALDLAFFDLVDDDQSSRALSFLTLADRYLFFLESSQTFNLHHQVKFLLLVNPLLLEAFVFIELLVADGHDL